jgi:hypothetical protein
MSVVDDYFKLATCNIRCGTTASLWHDSWGFGVLRKLFPQQFSFAKNKNATVQYFSQNDVATNFNTPLSPIAMQQLVELQDMLSDIHLGTSLYDQWLYFWGSAIFTAGRAYTHMKVSANVSPVFAWVWKSCCRGRHKFTFWLLLKDHLSTRNILRRKNKVLDVYSYPMCSMTVEETMEHLFFSCPFSSWCWWFVHVTWDMNMHIFDRIVQARRDFGRKFFREILIVACWALWKHRNEVIFDAVNLSLAR